VPLRLPNRSGITIRQGDYKLEIKIPDSENIWEAVQITTGDTFIFHKGFKEEADVKDVFKFDSGYNAKGQIIYSFSRFDFNHVTPAKDSTIRMNRAIITFVWYIDPASDIIIKLKEAATRMNAQKAGLILPGTQG
jgi:hypothetical protein